MPAVKYSRKAVEVNAVQISQEFRRNTNSWPDFMKIALERRRGSIHSLYPLNEGCGSCLLILITLSGAKTVHWGNWIIEDEFGQLDTINAGAFSHEYDEIQ